MLYRWDARIETSFCWSNLNYEWMSRCISSNTMRVASRRLTMTLVQATSEVWKDQLYLVTNTTEGVRGAPSRHFIKLSKIQDKSVN